ncbi:PF01934 family protein [Leptospira inadai serovar Lyme str. 10]|uniref:PF01934 family protein n=2 Tax=Leptospira inadai serovar Lyme TaxID=293084 RepID=V6HV61_9LEPT|nr:HepT-like ribonuclease domain-containing protein [Leptospira inadai]EQA36709.1 PF01934 family protein [Leptospira inadai serovar Lyme str. 10]PNV75548.1 DUF86 domain-containing protein [Leptospira inadai serovar Lyme]
MQRDFGAYLQDIVDSINEIEKFTAGINSKSIFLNNIEKKRAVERDIEIIGEAVKKLPDSIRSLHPEIEWKKIAGIRDILAHGYFSIDDDIIWDIVKNRLASLKEACSDLLKHPDY